MQVGVGLALLSAVAAAEPPAPPRRALTHSPQLCVCVLSYKRLDLLRTTLRSIVSHLEQVETSVAYELVWVDNGSDEAERQQLHREFAFEKALLLGTNYGLAYGFNSLFFRLCSAPYFLSLEEDWQWIGDEHGAGASVIGDAIRVLQHDEGVSGVFLRPDTLDQFLTRSEWKAVPARAPDAVGAASVNAAGVATEAAAGSAASAAASGVEYATYCLDREAAYMWGPYSNGPGVYDRRRLQRLVGRQWGEPTDRFPDPASESNYCYRVGAAGLCSAILRVHPECSGVHHCNAKLFRHLGDERSHGYGRGVVPEVRWMVSGTTNPIDQHIVTLRELGAEATPHWLSVLLDHDGAYTPPLDGRIALLLAAPTAALADALGMLREARASAHAPSLIELAWLVPFGRDEALEECVAAASELGGDPPPLRCVAQPREAGSIAERFDVLSSAVDAELLLLCPLVVTKFGPMHAEPADEARPAAPRWDAEARSLFGGDGDVRDFAKDRVLLVQASAPDGGVPPAHALVHRDALSHLGYAGPPAASSWLVFSLWLQDVFGALGRHRRLRASFVEAPAEEEARVELRAAFVASAAQRGIDTHKLQQLLLLLRPKSRSAFERATEAYRQFADLYNQGRRVEGWPLLSELLWCLHRVQASRDWALRDVVEGSMLPAALDLQGRLLDDFNQTSVAAQ